MVSAFPGRSIRLGNYPHDKEMATVDSWSKRSLVRVPKESPVTVVAIGETGSLILVSKAQARRPTGLKGEANQGRQIMRRSRV